MKTLEEFIKETEEIAKSNGHILGKWIISDYAYNFCIKCQVYLNCDINSGIYKTAYEKCVPTITETDYITVIQSLLNKKLINVENTKKGDEGFRLTFEGGIVLEVAFSGDEGSIYLEE